MVTFNQLTLQVLSETHQYDIDNLPATLSKEKKLTIIASRLNHIELLQRRPILGGIASIGPNTYDHRGFFLETTNNADKRKRWNLWLTSYTSVTHIEYFLVVWIA